MPIANIKGISHAYRLSAPVPSDTEPDSPAETLVFIHGWLLSQAYWQPLVSQLSAHYRCLTYDMRGFGESTQGFGESKILQTRHIQLPPGREWYPGEDTNQYAASLYSLAAYAQDLGELLDQLGLNRVWLVGHSLGGSVALWAAYLLPERVKGVICLNAGGGVYIPKEFEKFRAAGRQMVKFRPLWLANLPLLPRVFTRAMVHQQLDIKWGQQRLRDFIGADRAAAEGALLESTTCEEVQRLPQLIGQLTQPVHFITATQDSIMLPRYVRYLASFHPQFDPAKTVFEIPDCGHMAMVEQPQAIATAIKNIVATPAIRRAGTPNPPGLRNS